MKKLLNLKEASGKLGVTPEVLLEWNEHNILKPTITQTGEIGYGEDQIDQFLSIRQLTQAKEREEKTYEAISVARDVILNTSNSDNLEPQQVATETVRWPSTLLILSFSGIIIFSLIALFAQNRLSIFAEKEKFERQASLLEVSEDAVAIHPIQFKEEKNKDVLGEIFTASNALRAVLGERTGNEESAEPSIFHSEGLTFANKSPQTYAQVGGSIDDTHSAIDENGNIKGEAKSDVFATTIDGIGGVLGQGQSQDKRASGTQLLLLTVTGLGAAFLFRKQLYYAFVGHKMHNPVHADALPTLSQKVLEVDQKMDGTVVIRFFDKEYRLSRPELYSESDHLIQRLMGLTRDGVKEIDYQSLNDEEISLTAPLSKLVTRLGFVGIKRELFFPRTSKDRVLFRRYLTETDLASLNVSADEISSGLIKQA